ncbi:MAG TPA: type II toxin-antitoxin system RelE/ParE family toxin [Spirochaetia bacterium]|nr:type II toxin-antitoxin system RelE/ParE family toxin [Spirochaetia bacterium]
MSKAALKYYNQITDKGLLRDIDKCLSQMEKNPFFAPEIKKMKGDYKGYYRITTDGYRIVYRIDKINFIVEIVSIGPRGGVYK